MRHRDGLTVAASPGITLQPGDTVRTGRGARMLLRLDEGSDGGLHSSRNSVGRETALLDEPRRVENVGVGVPEPLKDVQA